MKVQWERLIRFIATDDRVLYGEPILPSLTFDLGYTTAETKLQARVIEGDIYDPSCLVTDEVVTVRSLLGPLTRDDVPILRCVGLNYMSHSEFQHLFSLALINLTRVVKETGRSPPPTPSIFFKPNTTVTDHGSDVLIPRIAQDQQADYEGELVCRGNPMHRQILILPL